MTIVVPASGEFTQEQNEALAQVSAPVFDTLNQFEGYIPTVLKMIPSLPDVALEQIVAYSDKMERCAFLLRGAAAREIANRIAVKLTGGRGHKDTEGKGVKKHLAALAAQVGVSPRTIERDVQIVDQFFTDETGALTDVAGDTPLPRSFYEEALSADDPHSAIELAQSKRDNNPNYSRDQLRSDIQAQKNAVTQQQSPPDLEDVHWLKVGITQEARGTLNKLCDLTQLEPRDVVSAALIHYYKWKTQPQTQTYTNGKAQKETERIPGKTVKELIANETFCLLAQNTKMEVLAAMCEASQTTVRDAWRKVRRGGV